MKPKYITIHCSATRPSQTHNVDTIRAMHIKKRWADIGYHFVITREGEIQHGRPITKIGAHVEAHNTDNIGICMIGGVNENNKPVDNFTDVQWSALRFLITDQAGVHGIKQENIKGHRDWFPDFNGDGVIDSRDWLKVCPCFDVKAKLKEWLI